MHNSCCMRFHVDETERDYSMSSDSKHHIYFHLFHHAVLWISHTSLTITRQKKQTFSLQTNKMDTVALVFFCSVHI